MENVDEPLPGWVEYEPLPRWVEYEPSFRYSVGLLLALLIIKAISLGAGSGFPFVSHPTAYNLAVRSFLFYSVASGISEVSRGRILVVACWRILVIARSLAAISAGVLLPTMMYLVYV